FGYRLAGGGGSYRFYTSATDRAGTAEAVPPAPDAGTVALAITAAAVTVPASATSNAPIPASRVAATLSGASSPARGTITFRVFGPQLAPPAFCYRGGRVAGWAIVNGDGTYR